MEIKEINLKPKEIRVLIALQQLAGESEDGTCFPFRSIAKHAHMRRNDVRLSCRSLTRKGLAEFHRGLVRWDDSGFAGSGYCVSPAGMALQDDEDAASDSDLPGEPMI